MYQVVSFGSAILDIMARSKDFKVLKNHQVPGGIALCEVYGGKAEAEEITMGPGGGATNTAVSFSRKGLSAAPVAKVADDAAGLLIRNRLKEEKVGLEHLVTSNSGSTGMSVILVAADGGRSIVTSRGVAAKLESNDVDWEKLYQTKWFYISSLGGSWGLLEDAVYFANKHGIRVALNPGRAELEHPSKLKKLFSRIDVLLLNRMELSRLVDVSFEDEEGLFERARHLGTKLTVISEGKSGATAIRPHELIKVEAFKVVSMDDTGAGDAFGSGLVYGLVKGLPIVDALKIGAANGAAEVSKLGAQSGLLTEKEVKLWLKKKLNVTQRQLI